MKITFHGATEKNMSIMATCLRMYMEAHGEEQRPRPRDCVLYANDELRYHVYVWGTPKHVRVRFHNLEDGHPLFVPTN